MFVRPMIYRHHLHCLSRNIPHSGVHRVCPSRIILILDSQSSNNIVPLRLLLSWMPYLILKEYQMPDNFAILHFFYPGEYQNDVSIFPSQLGRTYSTKECTHSYIRNVPKLPLQPYEMAS